MNPRTSNTSCIATSPKATTLWAARGFIRRSRSRKSATASSLTNCLADEQAIGEANLAARLSARVELVHGVLGVDQGQDRVRPVVAGNLGIEEEGLGDRTGIGQAGGLDHHLVEGDLPGAPPPGEVGQGRPQVVPDAAAQAAVAELDDLLLAAGDDDLAVDVLLAELVLDDGDLPPVSLGEDAAEQRGFARSEEAREDGGGDERLAHAHPISTMV